MILFEDTYERELFLKKRFTYKVMKKLFKSFSHEFGTSLNCIMSLSSSAIHSESEQAISEKIKKKYFTPILKSTKIMHYIV